VNLKSADVLNILDSNMTKNQHGTESGALSAMDGKGDSLSRIIFGTLWTFVSPRCGFLFADILVIAAGVMLYPLKFREISINWLTGRRPI
jgi:hypothetical protein